MNKIILKILIGSLLIAIIVLWGGQQFYYMEQTKYRQQLENTINDKYLEGKNFIGAFYYDKLKKDSTSVYKVSDYVFDQLPWLNVGVGTVTFWGGQNFDHTNTIMKVLKSGKYEW